MVELIRLQSATQQAVDELIALGRELHSDDRSMILSELEEIVSDETAILMVAKDGDRIVGMATLYIIPKIGKKNSLLEDVIVDARYRGQGIGERLVRAVLEEGKSHGVTSVTLTSRAERAAAHHLYQKIGFVKKETDVFKITF